MIKKLPVPKLDDTLDRYKLWVKPLLSEKDYSDLVSIIEKFQLGIGIKLNDLLNEQTNIYSNTSWLSSSWFNSYLDGRLSPIIETNFSSEIKFNKKINIDIINKFILSLSKVCLDYRLNNFEKVFDARNNPISLNQFEILKGASRIPSKHRDNYNISYNNSNYISVFYKNNLYKVNIINDNNELLNIENIIKDILKNTKEKDYTLSTISFACAEKATELRNKYYDSNVFFDIVENSLFNISIFEEDLKDDSEKFHFYQYLKAKNSWCYKPLNFIYNINTEEFYVNVEHSFQDGGTILEIIKRAINLMDSDIKNIYASNDDYILVKEYFSSDYKNEADNIVKDYFERVNEFSFKNIFLDFDSSYFNNSFKGISKDAILQFTLQYGLLFGIGDIRGIYEAVDMREYKYGRTECVRSVSIESIDFLNSLFNYPSSKDTYNKLIVAEREHKNRIKSCKLANGVNRHLLGLYLMISKLEEANEIEEANIFFNHIAFKKISENFLSTTSLGYNPYMDNLLFTPVMDCGYGINYNFEPERMHFVISYYKKELENANKFFKALYDCVDKLKQIKN